MKIQLAVPEGRDLIIQTYLKLLQHLDSFQYDVLPTLQNAEHLCDTVFLPAAAQGEPILIAWKDTQPVGMLFWVIQHPEYTSRWKIAFDYGVFIEEGYRGQKIAGRLIQEGIKILQSLGVERVLSGFHMKNDAARKVSQELGYLPDQILTYLQIQKAGGS